MCPRDVCLGRHPAPACVRPADACAPSTYASCFTSWHSSCSFQVRSCVPSPQRSWVGPGWRGLPAPVFCLVWRAFYGPPSWGMKGAVVCIPPNPTTDPLGHLKAAFSGGLFAQRERQGLQQTASKRERVPLRLRGAGQPLPLGGGGGRVRHRVQVLGRGGPSGLRQPLQPQPPPLPPSPPGPRASCPPFWSNEHQENLDRPEVNTPT